MRDLSRDIVIAVFKELNLYINNKLEKDAYKIVKAELCNHEKQIRADERKKVCEQIYKLFTNESFWKEIKKWWLYNGECKELKNVLDQVEKGENNERNS